MKKAIIFIFIFIIIFLLVIGFINITINQEPIKNTWTPWETPNITFSVNENNSGQLIVESFETKIMHNWKNLDIVVLNGSKTFRSHIDVVEISDGAGYIETGDILDFNSNNHTLGSSFLKTNGSGTVELVWRPSNHSFGNYTVTMAGDARNISFSTWKISFNNREFQGDGSVEYVNNSCYNVSINGAIVHYWCGNIKTWNITADVPDWITFPISSGELDCSNTIGKAIICVNYTGVEPGYYNYTVDLNSNYGHDTLKLDITVYEPK
jgi:hypothetical protein